MEDFIDDYGENYTKNEEKWTELCIDGSPTDFVISNRGKVYKAKNYNKNGYIQVYIGAKQVRRSVSKLLQEHFSNSILKLRNQFMYEFNGNNWVELLKKYSLEYNKDISEIKEILQLKTETQKIKYTTSYKEFLEKENL